MFRTMQCLSQSALDRHDGWHHVKECTLTRKQSHLCLLGICVLVCRPDSLKEDVERHILEMQHVLGICPYACK